MISPEVKGSQDVEIYDPITVEPSYTLFPWDPSTRCQHNFTAKVRFFTSASPFSFYRIIGILILEASFESMLCKLF